MKNILLSALVILLTACGTSRTDPEKVAEKYLNAYYRYEYLEASEYLMPGTRQQLEMAAEGMKMQGITPRDLRRENAPAAIHVYDDGLITGENAYVSYSLSNPDGEAADGREILVLHLLDGKWWVVY